MKKILQLLIVLLTLTGCQKSNTPLKVEEGLPEGVVRVPITLALPTPSKITTRAAVDLLPGLENRIAKVCIAVFEAPTATVAATDKLLQLADGASTIIDDNSAHVLLEEHIGDYRLMAIVNYSDNVNTQLTALKADLANGTATYSQFVSLSEDLTAMYVGGDATAGQIEIGGSQNLTTTKPMYSLLLSGTDIVQSTHLTLNLSNSYSRITVDASSVATSTYVISSATLLKGALMGSYDPSISPPISTIGSSAIQYNDTEALHKLPIDLVNSVSPIYLFPNSGDNGNNPTDVIIKGDYTDPKGHTYTGFHKIRIKHLNMLNNLTYDIVSNTLYRISITKVNSAGYNSFAAAKAAEPNSNIIYDIIVDDEASQDIITNNGEYYIGVSNSDIIVYDSDALVGLSATTFNFNLSTGATTGGITLPTPTVEVVGVGLSLTSLTASYTAGISNSIDVDLTAGFVSGTIIVRLGNIAHTINVSKELSQAAASSTLNDFATDTYVYGVFDDMSTSTWLTFTNDPTSSHISSDTGGIPLSLAANITGTKITATPLYLFRKDAKGHTKVIISQN